MESALLNNMLLKKIISFGTCFFFFKKNKLNIKITREENKSLLSKDKW